MYAFEKSLEAGLEDPMRQSVSDLLVRVRGGMPPDRALDLMQESISHEHFRDLITAIRFNFRHRGNLPALLEQIEIQLHRIEEEFDRRRLSNARDLGLTLLIILVVPALFLARVLGSQTVLQVFLDNPLGLGLLLISLLAYLSAIISLLLIQRRITG
jgi:Flp pilus assembly protein TadB